MNIAFLGLGAMGSRMARHLINSDHTVTLWNRSTAATLEFLDSSATVAASPEQAVAEADVVFCMVRDDTASRDVWLSRYGGALAAMKTTAIGVECSTLSVPYVRELGEAFAAQGKAFLEAPLAGSRPQAEQQQLIFLAGGEPTTLATVQPLLLTMGANVHHAGSIGSGATVKLMVNALLGTQLALMGELIGFAAQADVDPEVAVKIVSATPVCSPALKVSAAAMLNGQFAPAFPIDLVAKDFSLLMQSQNTQPLPLSQSTQTIYQAAVKEGFGQDNITGIVQRYWPKAEQ